MYYYRQGVLRYVGAGEIYIFRAPGEASKRVGDDVACIRTPRCVCSVYLEHPALFREVMVVSPRAFFCVVKRLVGIGCCGARWYIGELCRRRSKEVDLRVGDSVSCVLFFFV